MKKFLIASLLIISIPFFYIGSLKASGLQISSPWVILGQNIYYSRGNVGIGTTSPGYSLDVNGSINLPFGGPGLPGYRAGGVAIMSVISGSSVNVGNASAYDLNLFSGDATARMVILNSSGNVGIGTASPVTTLTVNGGINSRAYSVGATPTPGFSGAITVLNVLLTPTTLTFNNGIVTGAQ